MIENSNVYLPCGSNLPSGIVDITHGGTSSTSKEGVLQRFNAITNSMKNARNGIAVKDPVTGVITTGVNETQKNSSVAIMVTSYNNNYLTLNQVLTFTIENYNPNGVYIVSANIGNVTREGDTVTYTSPNSTGVANIVLNNKTYTYNIVSTDVLSPSITSPLNNATGVATSLTFTSSDLSKMDTGVDATQHNCSSWELSTNSSFSVLVKSSYNDTVNKTAWSVTDLDRGTTYYVRVKYKDNDGLWSGWSTTLVFSTVATSINKPSITSPLTGTTVDSIDSFNLVSSAYSITNGTVSDNPHLASDWQVATDNTFTNIVVNNSNDTVNKTAYTATGLNLGTTYYVRVRYGNVSLGYSEWSETVVLTTATYVEDASGRKFVRHASGKGTVMIWKDKSGTTHKTLVLDAPYRAQKAWCANTSTDVSGITNYSNSWYYMIANSTTWDSTNYPPKTYGATTSSAFFGTTWTDATINGKSMYFEDANTSKSNTNALMANSNCNTTTYAAGWCRSQTVDGTGCDLPNIQTLIRIYLSMFKLDEMDPSADSNELFRFTNKSHASYKNWYFNNSTSGVWSSSEYSSSYAWGVGCRSVVNNTSKTGTFCVVPVLELE